MNKAIKIKLLEALDTMPIAQWAPEMKQSVEGEQIDKVNWSEFPYCPSTKFYVAYTPTMLCIHYDVCGEGVKALYANDQEPVWQDSCVEFFCCRDNQEGYYNFEFNCIGTCLSAVHVTRENRTSRPTHEMERIKRHASLKRETFDEIDGMQQWSLTVGIPLDLLGIDYATLPAKLNANFYKCGDGTKHMHYVSWAPIGVEKPDFHRPDYFGELHF